SKRSPVGPRTRVSADTCGHPISSLQEDMMAARTNAGGKFYISDAPAPDELDQAGFEGLTWIEVSRVGSVPESGSSTNILTYDTLDQEVIEKAKGMTDAGGGQLEVALVPDDPGQ